MVNEIQESQWEYLLDPCFELSNSAGKPLTNGWIEVYIAGSNDKYYCASDFSGTLHPFQIPLDSLGSNIVLASPDNSYNIYVYNQYGSLIMSRYNVKCHGGSGSSTYVGDRLYYGQFMATDVATQAGLTRVTGNIDVDDGMLELKQGMSYHITLRGDFVVNDVSNVDTVLSYIEYSAVKPINVNVDYTKDGSQYFEISYDIYRLAEDMDYPVSFMQSNGLVKNLVVEVHSLSNLATSASGGGSEYEPGWGIVIQNNDISVDSSILNDYATHEEVIAAVSGITGIGPGEVYTAGDYISIEDNTISVTGINPEDYATHDEVINAVTSINLDEYATHEEVYNSSVTAINLVTGMIPAEQVQSDWDQEDENEQDYIKNKPHIPSIELDSGDQVTAIDGHTLAGTGGSEYNEGFGIDIRNGEISIDTNIVALASAIPPAQVQSDWNQNDDSKPDYIKNKPDLSVYVTHDALNGVTGIIQQEIDNIDLSDYSTHTEVYNATVTAIQVATGAIPEMPEEEEVEFEEINLSDYALASAIPDVSDFVTHVELIEAVSAVTGLGEYGQFYCAACTGTAELGKVKGTLSVTNDGKVSLKAGCSYHVTVRGGVEVDPTANTYGAFGLTEFITGNSINSNIDRTIEDTQYFEISYDLYNLSADTDYQFAFTNVGGEVNGLYVEIHEIGHVGSGSGGVVTGTAEYDAGWGINIVNNVISVDPTVIPEQVQSDWAETASALPSFIKNKPVEYDLVAGQNISISVSGTNVVISSTGGSGGATYTEGFGIDITNNEIAVDPNVVALASAVNPDNVLTYKVSTWADFRTMLDSGTNGVFLKDNSEYAVDGIYDVGVLTHYDASNANFIRIMDGMTGTGNGRARIYTLTSAGAWSKSYVKLAPKVEGGFGIDTGYNYATDIETLSINTDVVALASAVPVIELNGASQVTAIDGHALAGGGSGGPSYTPGTGIDITNDVISVDNTVAMKTDIPELPEEEEVEFEELNLGDYALASAVPTVQLDGNSQVTAIDGHTLAGGGGGGSTYTEGLGIDITNDEISIDPSVVALVSAIPTDKLFIANVNRPSTSKADLDAALAAGKAIFCKVTTSTYGTSLLPMTRSGNDYVFMADTMNMGSYGTETGRKTIVAKYLNDLGWDYGITDSCVTKSELNTAIAGIDTYTAGDGIDITNNVISVDNTEYISYAASGIILPNSKFELDADGQAYKVSSITSTITPSRYRYGVAFFSSGITFPAGAYTVNVPTSATAFTLYVGGTKIAEGAVSNGVGQFTLNNSYVTTSDEEGNTMECRGTSLYSGVTINFSISGRSDTYAMVSDIPTVQLDSNNQVTAIDGHALAAGASYTEGTGIDITNDVISVDNTVALKTDIPDVSNLATKSEVTAGVQAATGLIPTNINPLVTANITDIQVVNSLPGSPVSTVLYLIPEV